MSAPALSRRPRPDPVLVVDADDVARFRAWLAGRGYADRTAIEWIRRVRWAYAHGARSPGEIDAVFGHLSQERRAGLRQALGAFLESREARG